MKHIREPNVNYYCIIHANVIFVDKPKKQFLLFMDSKIRWQNTFAKMMLSLLDTQ